MSAITIAGDTSGSITLDAPAVAGSNTLTLPAATGTVIYSNASGNLLFNSGYGSLAVGYGCRAWVNFNGTGTVAISASGNVSSITDNGTGKYRINFTTAMPDANYAAGALGTEESGNAGDRSDLSIQSAKGNGSFATSYLDVTSVYSSSAVLFDAFKITVAVFR